MVTPASFAPPDGKPYRYDVREMRDVDGKTFHAGATYRLVFRHEPGGTVAELTLIAIDGDDESNPIAKLRATMAGKVGDPLRIHLDPEGRPIGVDRQEAIWSTFIADVRRLAAPPLADRLSGPLAAMSAQQRLATIAAPVARLIAADTVARPAGDRAVTIPATEAGGPAPVVGHERITTQGDTVTAVLETDSAAAVTATTPAFHTHLSRTRMIDRKTGLVDRSIETRTTTATLPAAISTTKAETTIHLTPWYRDTRQQTR